MGRLEPGQADKRSQNIAQRRLSVIKNYPAHPATARMVNFTFSMHPDLTELESYLDENYGTP